MMMMMIFVVVQLGEPESTKGWTERVVVSQVIDPQEQQLPPPPPLPPSSQPSQGFKRVAIIEDVSEAQP